MLQDPKPSKIYGVRVGGDDYAAALASLEAADDVTFVSLAEEVSRRRAAGANPATDLHGAQGPRRARCPPRARSGSASR